MTRPILYKATPEGNFEFTEQDYIEYDAMVAQFEAQKPQMIKNEIINNTQRRLDEFAKTRGYDGILSACTYASSKITKFATEGQKAVDLRDQTWGFLFEYMAEVEAGTKPMPTGYADVESLLPVLTW